MRTKKKQKKTITQNVKIQQAIYFCDTQQKYQTFLLAKQYQILHFEIRIQC